MSIVMQQATAVLLCVLLSKQWAFAVVNTGKSVASSEMSKSSVTNSASSSTSDSIAESSDSEASRRELPAGGLSDSYGVPIPSNLYGPPLDSYAPLGPSNPGVPIPVYGVPDGPSKNVIYPAPPTDLPPPLPALPTLPSGAYGPPKPVYGPPLKLHPPTSHKAQFHKPIFNSFNSFKSPRPVYGPPPPVFIPKPQYGPPKPIYGPPKLLKPIYGPPLKLNFIPPKSIIGSSKPLHGPIKLNSQFGSPLPTYGPPHQVGPNFGPPKNIYGPPKEVHGPPAPVYGPPELIPHGPPHPGAPAPPTPPDIKYDGWQPIPGLVSRPASNLYETPQQVNDHGFGLTPPANDLSLTYASSFAHASSGATEGGFNAPSDSYGAPLNSVTGSGGVASSSIGHSGGHSGGSFGFGGDSSLSVVKSIGYELFPNGQISEPLDSYGAPPSDSFAADGPYSAALKGGPSSFGFSDIGLIPPSGLYGVPPGSQYGTPILVPPKNFRAPSNIYGAPNQLNALDINPPKSPVVFREPVPPGLITSIGESVVQKDAYGIKNSQSNIQDQAYIPPPVPDITKQTHFGGSVRPINPPSNLYSLPNADAPTSFQSVVHDLSSFGGDLGGTGSFKFDQGFNGGQQLTSYTAPLGAIDSSYGIPPLQPHSLTANFDHGQNLDFGGALASSYQIPQISLQSSVPLSHDCSQHKSQPVSSFGIPSESASSYTASISALNTNIEGQSNYQIPSFNFNSDLQSVHSLNAPITVPAELTSNAVDINGKTLGQEYFAQNTEFQQSQEIHIPNGVQNIPVQGTLGSYTLQIQPADGLIGQNPSEVVPHEQVLSEGLIQSILAAIEQPSAQQQLPSPQQSMGYNNNLQHPSAVSYQEHSIIPEDGEAQHSVTRQVIITPPTNQQQENTTILDPGTDSEQQIQLIDNNEIALYFNNDQTEDNSNANNNDNPEVVLKSESGISNNKDHLSNQEVRNGQQYGSFVSFKTPHSSFIYGDMKNNNETQPVVVDSEKTIK